MTMPRMSWLVAEKLYPTCFDPPTQLFRNLPFGRGVEGVLVPETGTLAEGVVKTGVGPLLELDDESIIAVLSTEDERVEAGRRGKIMGMLNVDAGDGGLDGGCDFISGGADTGGVGACECCTCTFVIVPLLDVVDMDGGTAWN